MQAGLIRVLDLMPASLAAQLSLLVLRCGDELQGSLLKREVIWQIAVITAACLFKKLSPNS